MLTTFAVRQAQRKKGGTATASTHVAALTEAPPPKKTTSFQPWDDIGSESHLSLIYSLFSRFSVTNTHLLPTIN